MQAQALIEDAERRLVARDPAGASARLEAAADARGTADWGRAVQLAQAAADALVAARLARRRLAERPQEPTLMLWTADLIGLAGDPVAALALAQAALARDPAYAEAAYYAGTWQAQLGAFDEAVALFRRAAALKPALTAAWEQIAPLKRFTPDDPDLSAMIALEQRFAAAGAGVRAPLLFALGKAFDDLDDTDRAFAAIAEANRLIAAERRHDPGPLQAFARAQRREFDAALVGRQAPGSASERAIFVTGLPRSGTTVVEQMLASHSAVAGGGELNLFAQACLPLGDGGAAGITRWAAAGGRWDGLGERYLDLLARRFGQAGRIVDKTLNTTVLMGAARLALPKAPVVWLERDPADVAWSAFRNNFVFGQDWCFDLDHIARHMRTIALLRDHWRALFGEAILLLNYEALVADPAVGVGRLLAHCGLPKEPGVRDFHLNRRAVATASLAQVRRPLSDRSIGAWRRYERHLGPFFAAYG